MLAPRSRLLVWVAVVVLPFALLAGVEPAATTLSLAFIGALLIAAVLDAISAQAALKGLSIVLPEVARFSKDRPGKLELRIRNERQKTKTLRIAVPLPREFESEHDETFFALPAGSEWSRVNWPCVPRKRGTYRVGSIRLEASSPLGFWGLRRSCHSPAEIRVYPNLARDRKQLA